MIWFQGNENQFWLWSSLTTTWRAFSREMETASIESAFSSQTFNLILLRIALSLHSKQQTEHFKVIKEILTQISGFDSFRIHLALSKCMKSISSNLWWNLEFSTWIARMWKIMEVKFLVSFGSYLYCIQIFITFSLFGFDDEVSWVYSNLHTIHKIIIQFYNRFFLRVLLLFQAQFFSLVFT